eukprot:GEMP01065041.1.p1 GENE.GEMP01065041.1~~GEMP01065041.1.p1  ORF type:complete len:239 (+),score=49.57 GEMP01065041.1:267-983(+)
MMAALRLALLVSVPAATPQELNIQPDSSVLSEDHRPSHHDVDPNHPMRQQLIATPDEHRYLPVPTHFQPLSRQAQKPAPQHKQQYWYQPQPRHPPQQRGQQQNWPQRQLPEEQKFEPRARGQQEHQQHLQKQEQQQQQRLLGRQEKSTMLPDARKYEGRPTNLPTSTDLSELLEPTAELQRTPGMRSSHVFGIIFAIVCVIIICGFCKMTTVACLSKLFRPTPPPPTMLRPTDSQEQD